MGGRGCGTHNKPEFWPLPRKNVVWWPGHPNSPGGMAIGMGIGMGMEIEMDGAGDGGSDSAMASL